MKQLSQQQGVTRYGEEVCQNTEKSLILREQELEKDRKQLLEDRIRLDDRSRTLERAINRLKK